ncbi:MAG: ABC transporter substrate-binding protein [Clostridiales bacterium]|nr:ABC transporter substrate-binding protein [Eubacteriales bacterium]NLO16066.1 ABC transporter substrate-binding protein [Clostridiales bacterium]
MKKLVSLLLALLLVLGLMPAVLAQDVIELDMYFPVAVGGGPDALINTLCEEFHAEYPTIKINPVYAGSYADTRTKVIAAIQANNTPAIALMFSIDLYQLFSMGVLYDYNSFCTTDVDKAWLEGFYPGFMENSRLPQADGSYLTYGIPWQRSTIIMYYNKDAFKEAGLDPEAPPTTWAELAEYGKKLVKQENGTTSRYGIQIPSDKAGYAYWMLQTFTLTQGGQNLMSADGSEVFFNHPKTIKGLEFWKKLSDDGIQAPGVTKWSTTVSDFLEQRAAIIYHTTGNLTNVKKNATFEFGTSRLAAEDSYGSPTGGGNFYLFKGVPEEQTQAAFTFIKWMTSNPERVAQWSIDTGYVATRPEAYETQLMKDYTASFPSALTARDQLEYAYAEFSVYDQGAVQDILDTAIEEVMTGVKDAPAALAEAQDKADAILADYR